MQNLNKKPSKIKKIILVCLVIILVVAGVYAAFAAANSLWPFRTESSKNEDTQKEGQQKDGSQSEDKPPKNDTSPDNSSNNSDPDQSVVTPPATPPSNNASFPVENAHYRIEKTDNSHYTITLYAILNNPSQHDEYTSQLREYKKEALAYLNNRLGTTENITINWNPPAAKDL